MNIENVIEKNKITLICEDINSNDKDKILEAKVNVGLCFESLRKYSGNIIVIGDKEDKIDIFERAIEESVIIDYEFSTQYKLEQDDFSKFNNKVVVYCNFYNAMSSTNSKIYINMVQIAESSMKFIAIDTIGENYIQKKSFQTLLNFKGVSANIENSNIEFNNNLLLEHVTIIENNEVINSINKNYFEIEQYGASNNSTYTESIKELASGFDVSAKSNFDQRRPPSYSMIQDMKKEISSLKKENEILLKKNYELENIIHMNKLAAEEARNNSNRNMYDNNVTLNNRRQKNNPQYWILFFLTLFLGVFGVQHFMYGRVGAGILRLFTFGGCFILVFYDLILIALQKFKDEKGQNIERNIYV